MYLQSKINKKLDDIGEKIINRKSDVFELKKLLEKKFSSMGVKIGIEKNKEVSEENVFFTGFFDPTLSFEDDDKDIEIVISYNGNSELYFTDHNFEQCKFLFSVVLQHELIHRYQQLRRGDKQPREYKSSSKSKTYYGNSDEIDARAHDISLEITRNKCYNLIRNPKEASLKTSETLFTYVILFGVKSKIFKKLMKKVYSCLNHLECHWNP